MEFVSFFVDTKKKISFTKKQKHRARQNKNIYLMKFLIHFATFCVASAASAVPATADVPQERVGRHLDVSCGAHFASTCSECPQGNGAAWCNGDCVWENDECVEKPPKTCADGSFADSCSECPSEQACNGDDCAWQPTNVCRDKFSNNVRTASVHLRYSPPIKPIPRACCQPTLHPNPACHGITHQ